MLFTQNENLGVLWETQENIDKIIEFNDKEVLKNNGTISYEQMKEMVEKVYKTFDNKRKKQEAIEADYIDLEELKDRKSVV